MMIIGKQCMMWTSYARKWEMEVTMEVKAEKHLEMKTL